MKGVLFEHLSDRKKHISLVTLFMVLVYALGSPKYILLILKEGAMRMFLSWWQLPECQVRAKKSNLNLASSLSLDH